MEDPNFFHAAGVLAAFVVLQWAAREAADISEHAIHTSFLLPQTGVVGVGLIAALSLGSLKLQRTLSWESLDHGRQLQVATTVLMALATWRLAAGARNFYFDQWFAVDRVLLVLVMALAVWRPAFTPVWVVYARILQQPLRATPFVVSGLEIDEMVIKMVTILAAATLFSGWRRTSRTGPGLAIMSAALASDFFLPGRVKIREGWIHNDLSNVPLNGYAQGWLGSSDGSLASSLANLLDSVGTPLVLAALAFETGAILLLLHRRTMMVWSVVAIGFHVFVFLSYGFVFTEFVLVELMFLSLVLGAAGKDWSTSAFSKGPKLIALIAVALGPTLFHSPVLVWFDGPIVYRYEIDGVDTNGRRWALEAEHFVPYDDVFAFGNLGLADTVPLVGPYGAVGIGERQKINALSTLEEVTALEVDRPNFNRENRMEILKRFLLSTQPDSADLSGETIGLARRRPVLIPPPPRHFLTSRQGPNYRFDVPLMTLEVVRVTWFRDEDQVSTLRHEDIATVEIVDGEAIAQWTN